MNKPSHSGKTGSSHGDMNKVGPKKSSAFVIQYNGLCRISTISFYTVVVHLNELR
jgi:hypothetical protein